MLMSVRDLWMGLNAARIERGISWRALAREAGVSASTVSRMPDRSPNIEGFQRLLVWLGEQSPHKPCAHDDRVMTVGIGTLADPPTLRSICLKCGRIIRVEVSG
jgi:predicted transcriptional regulator